MHHLPVPKDISEYPQFSDRLNRMPRIFAIIIVSISLAGIGGCKTSPLRNPGDTGAAIPATWAADKGTPRPTPENWVETFGDPNLSALVNSALADNYQLKAVAARVKAAVAQARIDGASRWPQLFFAPGYQYAQIREAGFGSARFSVFEALFSPAGISGGGSGSSAVAVSTASG